MVQIITERPKRPSFSERLGIGVGRGIEGATQLYQQHQLEKAHPELAGLPPEYQKMGYESKLKQQENENRFAQQLQYNEEGYEKVKNLFGPEVADIWKVSEPGAQTILIKSAIEANNRGMSLGDMLKGLENPSNNNFETGSDFEEVGDQSQSPRIETKTSNLDKEIDDYLRKQDEGLLPAEKVKRGKERYDSGLKQYLEAGTKLRSMTMDKQRIGILENLNKSKKLPQDLGRLNVDSEGNLRAPFLASPESQRYVKTLNEFSQGAKDTFGSRVTNFDLSQYLKRFPTLLNSEEARSQLLEQMKIVNQVNSVYYKNLKDVYDKAGGARNIDADVAERFAEKKSEPQIVKLSERFNQIGNFSTKPNPAEFEGKRIRDKKTGEVFISDGVDWVPEE